MGERRVHDDDPADADDTTDDHDSNPTDDDPAAPEHAFARAAYRGRARVEAAREASAAGEPTRRHGRPVRDAPTDGTEAVARGERWLAKQAPAISADEWLAMARTGTPPIGRAPLLRNQPWPFERCKTLTCAGRRSCVGFSVDDETWRAVMPEHMQSATVCLECFDERAQAAGVRYKAEVFPVAWCDDAGGEER